MKKGAVSLLFFTAFSFWMRAGSVPRRPFGEDVRSGSDGRFGPAGQDDVGFAVGGHGHGVARPAVRFLPAAPDPAADACVLRPGVCEMPAGQVEKLRRGRFATKLSLDAANYVRNHLSEPVSVGRMAEEFFFSRPYLSARFKKETGQSLTDFILSEKTEEAKRLIRYTDKSLTAVSAYLGFSSQSHFIRVFRKYAGVTPGEYLEKHRR